MTGFRNPNSRSRGTGILKVDKADTRSMGKSFLFVSSVWFVSNFDVCGCGTQKRAKSSEIL